MRRFRPSDGTPAHRRGARYHISRCKLGKSPLHATLAAEGAAVYSALVTKSRAAEDAEDAATEAGAVLDAAEIDVENTIRELDGVLAQLDRQSPELGAQSATFPEGFGAVIEPEGEDQLSVLPALLVRVAPFKADPAVAPVLVKLDTAAAQLKAAIKSATTAADANEAAFAEEVGARTAVREQLESAYGRLRDLYKSRPMLAEGFFLKDNGARRAPKKGPSGGGGAPT